MPLFPWNDPNRLDPNNMIQPAAVTVRPGVDINTLSPRAKAMFDKINELDMPGAIVNSGHRDAGHNAAVGGARGSQHIQRNAIDVNVAALNEEQKRTLMDQAQAGGARGFGVYRGGRSLHFDTRDGPVATWGNNPLGTYKGVDPSTQPAWAQPAIYAAAGQPAPPAGQPAPSILAQAQARTPEQIAAVQPQGDIQGPPASASSVPQTPPNNGILAALGMNNETTDKIGAFMNSDKYGTMTKGAGILAQALTGGGKGTPAPQLAPVQDIDHKPDASLMAMLDPRRRRAAMMGV